jgi:hypothetical protein
LCLSALASAREESFHCRRNSHFSFWDHRQTDNRPYSGSTAPADLFRLNR